MEKHGLDDVLTNSQAKQTKKAEQWAASVFTGQLKQYKSILSQYYKKISLICTRESKRGVDQYYLNVNISLFSTMPNLSLKWFTCTHAPSVFLFHSKTLNKLRNMQFFYRVEKLPAILLKLHFRN